ncbi:MAG: hypothetical protein O2955_09310 [Planctomycetota bacterium]|nr:hypothetical protein [Planctomycetota bacterium]MDA1212706.1 hypothetical protein [Planctomycetota bacterium]
MMRILGFIGALFLSFAGLTQAGELMPAHVGADAKWVVHVNIEAIKAIPPVKEMHEKFLQKDKVQAKVKEISTMLGMNPTEDIFGVTAYSASYEQHKGVALIYVRNANRDKLVELFSRKHPDHKSTKYGDRTIYSWTESHRGCETKLSGTFASDGIILMGSGDDIVQTALDVIDGKKTAAGADAAILSGANANDLFFVKAVDIPEELTKKAKSKFPLNISGGMAQWQYSDNQVSAHYEVNARSAETAQALKGVVDGVKAGGILRYQELADVLKVINALSTEVNDQTMTVNFSSSLDEIKAGVEQAKKNHKEKRKKS